MSSYRLTWQMKNQLRQTLLKELLVFTEKEKNCYYNRSRCKCTSHSIWGSSNVNARGEELLAYCASANLNFCNEGNKPTFRTRKREEVLDLTLVNRNAWDRVRDWHVSDVLSLSDHMYIRFNVKSSIKRKTKMIRNVRSTHWERYTEELDLRLIEPTQMPTISSTEDIEELASKVQSKIIHSYEAACPLRKTRRRNENPWWNSELTSLRKEARRANPKGHQNKKRKGLGC